MYTLKLITNNINLTIVNRPIALVLDDLLESSEFFRYHKNKMNIGAILASERYWFVLAYGFTDEANFKYLPVHQRIPLQ
jgi:hypothetical protein